MVFSDIFSRPAELMRREGELTKNQTATDEERELISKCVAHGCLDMGTHSADVDVEQWLPEMNAVNVTLLCDRLIDAEPDGLMLLVTRKGDIDCLSVLSIEGQSSGFMLYKRLCYENKGVLLMKTCTSLIKQNLIIPDSGYWQSGFVWGEHHPYCLVPKHSVPTEKYKNKYILNFSVSGEFDLDIYYCSKTEGLPRHILSQSYCCK